MFKRLLLGIKIHQKEKKMCRFINGNVGIGAVLLLYLQQRDSQGSLPKFRHYV